MRVSAIKADPAKFNLAFNIVCYPDNLQSNVLSRLNSSSYIHWAPAPPFVYSDG